MDTQLPEEEFTAYVTAYQERFWEHAATLEAAGAYMPSKYSICRLEANAFANSLYPNVAVFMSSGINEKTAGFASRISALHLRRLYANKYSNGSSGNGNEFKKNENKSYKSIYIEWILSNDYIAADKEVAFWMGCSAPNVFSIRSGLKEEGYVLVPNNGYGYKVTSRPENTGRLSKKEFEVLQKLLKKMSK